jgi:anaerobic ribonucleoside-triphosphate reductase activating protein
MNDPLASIAHWTDCTEAEGPGKRFALWFQGCPMRCPGCCNPEMLPFEGGRKTLVSELVERVFESQRRFAIEGVTLLGGEPLAHAEAGAALAKRVRERGLSVMVFSGYTIEEARELPDPAAAELIAWTDILVDGRYERDLPDNSRRWIGSTNQRIHFLSDRYRPDDPCWRKRNTIEIRLTGGELSVNGFPAASAVGLWKQLPKAAAQQARRTRGHREAHGKSDANSESG